MRKIILSIATIFILASCGQKSPTLNETDTIPAEQKTLTQADKILDLALKAHGGNKYNSAHYEFVFRKKTYRFKNAGQAYEYTVTYDKEGQTYVNKLDNNGITQTIDGKAKSLSKKDKAKFSNALNSVIYFATLPHKLKDPAVNKNYKGTAKIKNENYHVLEVNFDEEGGGTDHDDNFCYWIHEKTNLIDYLAYDYQVNKGGVRFRSAFNTRNVGGIVFQDYINYKAPLGTALIALPDMFESNQLEELSTIATENVSKKG